MRKTMLIITLIAMVSSVLAQPLLAVSCPGTVYKNEIFSCSVLAYNDSPNDVAIRYYAHFNKGLARLLSNGHGKIAIPAFIETNEEFNAWAMEKGVDVFTYEYGEKEVDSIAGKRVDIVQSPIALELSRFKVTAGLKTIVKGRVAGKGDLVSLKIVLPPGVYGSKHIALGDVDGTADFNVAITTDPYYFGSVTVPIYMTFYDDMGAHVERYDVVMEVSPGPEVLAIGAAALALILGVMYLGIRRLRGSKPVKDED